VDFAKSSAQHSNWLKRYEQNTVFGQYGNDYVCLAGSIVSLNMPMPVKFCKITLGVDIDCLIVLHGF
jgi:hypothetical protein